jgi:hypothetical protein
VHSLRRLRRSRSLAGARSDQAIVSDFGPAVRRVGWFGAGGRTYSPAGRSRGSPCRLCGTRRTGRPGHCVFGKPQLVTNAAKRREPASGEQTTIAPVNHRSRPSIPGRRGSLRRACERVLACHGYPVPRRTRRRGRPRFAGLLPALDRHTFDPGSRDRPVDARHRAQHRRDHLRSVVAGAGCPSIGCQRASPDPGPEQRHRWKAAAAIEVRGGLSDRGRDVLGSSSRWSHQPAIARLGPG